MQRFATLLVATTWLLLPGIAVGQGLTGSLIGTVHDAEGGVLAGAMVRVSSPALIGGAITQTTNEKGHLRFVALPPKNLCGLGGLCVDRDDAKTTP